MGVANVGYIKLARKITENSIFDNPNLLKIWIWVLCKASHKEHEQMIGLQNVSLQKGQFIFGRKSAAAQLKMKESYVYKLIKALEKNGMIEVNSNNKFSVISVVNWGVYQDYGGDGVPTEEQQRNNSVTTKEQQSNTNKNVKNVKNGKNEKENIYCAFFDALWNLYPNKKGKSKVSAKSLQELNKLGFEKIKQCLDEYIRSKPEWQQWQNGSTFFNGGYKDYLDMAEAETIPQERSRQ